MDESVTTGVTEHSLPTPSSREDHSAARGAAVAVGHAELRLLPERAVWWAEQETLLVADLHLGKPASFRAGGAPVPEGADFVVIQEDVKRAGEVITIASDPGANRNIRPAGGDFRIGSAMAAPRSR